MQYLGIDWGTRKAAWCALDECGELAEGMVPADEDGLAWLVHKLGSDVRGCVEMMSAAVWVRERLRACGWEFRIADSRKVKAIAPLACKTDRVDARVLAQLARRDLVPEVWAPSLSDRELRERLRRRAHLVRLKTSARNRMFGLLTQWGLRGNLAALRQPGSLERLSQRGVPAVWVQSVRVLLDVVDDLERQLATIETELRPIASADPRVQLLETIPGIGELLALTIAAEIGEISRFANARKLIGYAGLAPTIKQSGQSSWTGRISKAGSPVLRWAAIEAAQHAWRPTNPWHRERERIRGGYWEALDEAINEGDGRKRLQALVDELDRCGYTAAAKCLADDLDALVVHLRYPLTHRRRRRSTNLLERSLVEVKRRTKMIGRFPGETSCLTLVWAVLDIYITQAKNGVRFNQLERQRLRRMRYAGSEQTHDEEVTAA